jgi:catechol 2,3-dioxygenase-like lactoylglutathione lyase family enzyme
MVIEKIHHVAYRCADAAETVRFYKSVLDMNLIGAIAEDRVPSTKAPDPYMHIFLDAGAGNILAFFELPNSPPMGRDPNTPDWVQHIALQVKDPPTTPCSSRSISAIHPVTGWSLRPPPARPRNTGAWANWRN